MKCVQARKSWQREEVRLLRNNKKQRQNIDKYNLEYEINKTKQNSQLVAYGYYSSIANCRTKIPLIFLGIFEIFAVFQNFYFFTPQFLAEPVTVLTEPAVGNRWAELKRESWGVLKDLFSWPEYGSCTRWFKCDRDKLWLVYTQSVPVIFEPPCTSVSTVKVMQCRIRWIDLNWECILIYLGALVFYYKATNSTVLQKLKPNTPWIRIHYWEFRIRSQTLVPTINNLCA
jgi:hypothetical protein